ncbi:MAG: phosphodiester glycosidase family protein [Chloroflexi bacterium]|nr:phosphodiester glycosidase family protein [Chloroflexota bacterium]
MNINRRAVIKLALLILLACVTCAGLTLLAVNTSPRLLPALLGLTRVGPLASALPPDPPPLISEGSPLDRVELLLPQPLRLTPADLGDGEIIGDATTPGASAYLLALDETALNALLQRHFLPDDSIGDRYRDLWVDLQPGGLVLYADVNLGLSWQRMGLLLLQEGEMALTPTGLVLDDELYALPDEGFLAQAIPRVQSTTAQALETLTLSGPLPGEARVSQVRFHADWLEILAQATYAVPPPPDTGWQPLEPGLELRQMDIATGSVLERLTIARLNPALVRFRVRYEPANPRPLSAWAAELRPLLMVNSGYFAPAGEATALLISNGQLAGTPLGDFGGMFAVTAGGQVSVRWLQEQPYDPAEGLVEAVQSFPVLVKPGGVMGFPADADDGTPARRTVVAQDNNERILIIVAPRGYLSLHEMAVFLTSSDLNIDIALNLDGGGSTGLWLNSGETNVEIDSRTPIPSVIVVEE